MAELDHCQLCGKVFVRTTKAVCPSCRKEVEQKFEIVYTFIRKKENREATIQEVHEETGVATKLIYQWVQEGRISTNDFPNLGYPCRACGSLITIGKLCSDCQVSINKDIKVEDELSRKRDIEKERTLTYFTKDN